VNSEALVQCSQDSATAIQRMLKELSSKSASTHALVQQSAEAMSRTQEMVVSGSLTRWTYQNSHQPLANGGTLESIRTSQMGLRGFDAWPANEPTQQSLGSPSPAELRPASQFELSSSFFPEQYTSKAKICRICVYQKFEKLWSSEERIEEYPSFLLNAPSAMARCSSNGENS
jgi:hypothetical protein